MFFQFSNIKSQVKMTALEAAMVPRSPSETHFRTKAAYKAGFELCGSVAVWQYGSVAVWPYGSVAVWKPQKLTLVPWSCRTLSMSVNISLGDETQILLNLMRQLRDQADTLRMYNTS
eukprot:GFUD01112740.1.p1 GENE.GFUD01112740.1~~GFUD01112740.1.p1  ORF type:complete len:117 (+),score=1.56 GFUD01112740.1:69-419(+)